MKASSKKVVYAALIGNALITVTKFAAAAMTGSSAMLSEGIHSLVDTGNQVLMLYGMKQATKPPTPAFPFGYGKEVYFWSFVVAMLMLALGSGVAVYEGVHSLMHPKPVSSPYINYVVLAFAAIFEGGAWLVAWKEFSARKGKWGYIEAMQRSKDPSVFVILFEDSAAMLGILTAFFGILLGQLTGNPYCDALASVIIGVMLGGTALWLAHETKGLLIGESANEGVVEGIRKLAQAGPRVRHVNEVLTMHMGPEYILANLSVNFEDGAAADDIEDAVAALTQRIKAEFPRVKRVFVEAEPKKAP